MTATAPITQLDELIKQAFTALSGNLRVCMPAKIETYNADTHIATVQPLLKHKFFGRADSVLLPSISRVPVIHPRTTNALIRLPIAKGSIVTLVFADRSIENWLAGNGDPRDTIDTRRHHLSDAYAIPGGYPEKLPWPANNPDALEIEVKPGTKMTFGNGSEDLLQLAHDAFSSLKDLCGQLSQAMTDIQLETHTVTAVGSPTGPPLNAASYATIKTTVDNISAAVDTTITDLGKIKV